MKRLTFLTCAALAAFAIQPVIGADDISREDKEFIKNAGELGLTEVQIGQLAAKNATSPELQALGAKLVADHTASNDELVKLAVSKNVQLTMEPTSAQKQMLAKFEAKTARFDKEMMEHIRKDSEKGLRTYADAAADSKDADIKAFAVKTVSSLTEHYKMAGGKVKQEH